MALADEVVARYPAGVLANLTNPGSPGSTSYSATRLGYACSDVEALFKIHAGQTFALTDARHVQVACECVILQLRKGLGATDEAKLDEAQQKKLRALAMVTGRDKVTPTTTCTLTPASDLRDGETQRGMSFDWTRFDGIQTEGPHADADSET